MGNVLYFEMDARRKLVLVVLADNSNDDGYCGPSLELIALKASISIRKCRDHLHALEQEGWVNIAPGRGGGLVNRYYLNLDKIRQGAEDRKEKIKSEKASRRNGNHGIDDTLDSNDVKPDDPNIKGDAEDTKADSGVLQNHQGTIKEPSKESSGTSGLNFLDSIVPRLRSSDEKLKDYERLKGWAELEITSDPFSDRQRASLLRAIDEVCGGFVQSELCNEIAGWTFLDDENKELWNARVKYFYSPSKAQGRATSEL